MPTNRKLTGETWLAAPSDGRTWWRTAGYSYQEVGREVVAHSVADIIRETLLPQVCYMNCKKLCMNLWHGPSQDIGHRRIWAFLHLPLEIRCSWHRTQVLLHMHYANIVSWLDRISLIESLFTCSVRRLVKKGNPLDLVPHMLRSTDLGLERCDAQWTLRVLFVIRALSKANAQSLH